MTETNITKFHTLNEMCTNLTTNDRGFVKFFKCALIKSKRVAPSYLVVLYSSPSNRDRNIEIYCGAVLSLSIAVLFFSPCLVGSSWRFVIYLIIGLSILETVCYTLNSIFCKNQMFESETGSIERKVVFLFIDFFILTIHFAALYILTAGLCYDDLTVTSRLDALYFSFVTTLTIGYGDILPQNEYGKIFVILQGTIFIIFSLLFLSFYTSKLQKDTTISQSKCNTLQDEKKQ